MKSYQLNHFGIDGLDLVDLPTPQPAPLEVLVRWQAWSLNYRDAILVDGTYSPNLPLPFTPLSDAAGEVVSVGTEVDAWAPGDRVISHIHPEWQEGPATPEKRSVTLGGPHAGLLAEYSVVPATTLVPAPSHLSFAEASTLPIAGVTAWNALFGEPGLLPGYTALFQGTGGVSILGLQLARAAGLRTIITSSSDEKLVRARALGADATINYRSTRNGARRVAG